MPYILHSKGVVADVGKGGCRRARGAVVVVSGRREHTIVSYIPHRRPAPPKKLGGGHVGVGSSYMQKKNAQGIYDKRQQHNKQGGG